MKLSTSYKQILQISLPLIIASFGHSLIGATDTFFLGRSGNTSFLAAIGLVAPLYLVITLVSLALARGGQIMIARRVGEGRLSAVGTIAQNIFYFELIFAALFFVLIYFGSSEILWFFIDNHKLLDISQEYLQYRVLGIFFGCGGVMFISLYTGVARTWIIILSSAIMAIVNIFLNYLLIFGNWGFPEMGMGGAGLASAISEFVALAVFIIFAIRDPLSKKYELLNLKKADFNEIIAQVKLSAPLALQSFLGLISWVIFFGLIENMGEQPMAISSIMRVIYLFLGAIGWGLGSGTNTIISTLLGQGKLREVVPTLFRITLISLSFTALASLPLLLIPDWMVNAITDDEALIVSATEMMPLLFCILLCVSSYTIFYNGIIGAGDIKASLIVTLISSAFYILYAVLSINYLHGNLHWAWSVEFVYGVCSLGLTLYYFLRTSRWFRVRL